MREALRQNAFLLGLEACKNKNNAMELGFIKRKEEQMLLEKSELKNAQEQKEQDLQTVKAKLYDIDFDFY